MVHIAAHSFGQRRGCSLPVEPSVLELLWLLVNLRIVRIWKSTHQESREFDWDRAIFDYHPWRDFEIVKILLYLRYYFKNYMCKLRSPFPVTTEIGFI